jgi:hypothetical protein
VSEDGAVPRVSTIVNSLTSRSASSQSVSFPPHHSYVHARAQSDSRPQVTEQLLGGADTADPRERIQHAVDAVRVQRQQRENKKRKNGKRKRAVQEQEEEDAENAELFVSERVVSMRVQDGKLIFKVKWAGYSEDDNTCEEWETVNHLDAVLQCVTRYWLRNVKRQKMRVWSRT